MIHCNDNRVCLDSQKESDCRLGYRRNSLPMLQQLNGRSDRALQNTFITLANFVEHYVEGIAQLLDHTPKGLRLPLLHFVEHTALVREPLEQLLHILELDHSLRDHIDDLCRRIICVVSLLEESLQLSVHIDAGLRELANLRATKIGRSLDLSVSENKTAHINTKSRRNVGEPLGGVIEFVVLNTVCRKLLGVIHQVFDAERRLDGQLHGFVEYLIGLDLVLQHGFQGTL